MILGISQGYSWYPLLEQMAVCDILTSHAAKCLLSSFIIVDLKCCSKSQTELRETVWLEKTN